MSPLGRESANVIDLGAIGDACRPLLRCYADICDGSESEPTLREMDAAVRRIKALPPIPGRIGQAIKTLTTGGRAGFPYATIGALELLRSIDAFRSEPNTFASKIDTNELQAQLRLF